jgi:type II secretory pathway pseudopilin PulG
MNTKLMLSLAIAFTSASATANSQWTVQDANNQQAQAAMNFRLLQQEQATQDLNNKIRAQEWNNQNDRMNDEANIRNGSFRSTISRPW